MARMKKDGTPAKKPGRKPQKIETPDGTLADAMQGMQDATEEFFGKCRDMGLKVETPEAPTVKLDGEIKIQAKDASAVTVEIPEAPAPSAIGYKIRGIEGEFGLFFYDHKHNKIDWTTPEGEEVSMDPLHWRLFIKQMPGVIRVLMAEGSK